MLKKMLHVVLLALTLASVIGAASPCVPEPHCFPQCAR
jgi:hypothetical protein